MAWLLTMLVSWSVMLLAAVVRGVYCLSRDLVLVALAQNSWEISILSNRFKSHILFLFLFVLKCSLIECEHLKWLREITSNQGLNLFSDVLPSSVSTLVSIKRWGLYNVHLQCTGLVYVGKEVTGIWEGDSSSNRKENNYKIPIRKKVMVKKYFFPPT